MPTFIVLGNTTERGRRGVADAPARLDAARKALERLGGKHLGVYLTMGPYDFVSVFEAPDDESAAKYILAVSARGYVKTISLKAFAEADFRRILKGGRPA
jgi:uncharacterized protein with GYD domain